MRCVRNEKVDNTNKNIPPRLQNINKSYLYNEVISTYNYCDNSLLDDKLEE